MIMGSFDIMPPLESFDTSTKFGLYNTIDTFPWTAGSALEDLELLPRSILFLSLWWELAVGRMVCLSVKWGELTLSWGSNESWWLDDGHFKSVNVELSVFDSELDFLGKLYKYFYVLSSYSINTIRFVRTALGGNRFVPSILFSKLSIEFLALVHSEKNKIQI